MGGGGEEGVFPALLLNSSNVRLNDNSPFPPSFHE